MVTALAVAVLASVLTAGLGKAGRVHRQIRATDIRIVEINEDLNRWVLDRDGRMQDEDLERTTVTFEGMPSSGRLGRKRRAAFEEWRNEASGKLRLFDALCVAEGRLHTAVRHRRDDWPGIELGAAQLKVLNEEWKLPDPSDPTMLRSDAPLLSDRGDRIRLFTQTGNEEFKRPRLLTGVPKQ